jgi:hypothetical protein
MSTSGPTAGTIQQTELGAEIATLNVANQLMIAIQGHWVPPGPTVIPAIIQQLNTIVALSNSIEATANALLAALGGPAGGPGP